MRKRFVLFVPAACLWINLLPPGHSNRKTKSSALRQSLPERRPASDPSSWPGLRINPAGTSTLRPDRRIPVRQRFQQETTFKVKEYVYPRPTRGGYEYSENELSVYEGEALIGFSSRRRAHPGPQAGDIHLPGLRQQSPAASQDHPRRGQSRTVSTPNTKTSTRNLGKS
jgi:hypothetical protein